MSSTSLRTVAATVAAVIALITAIATGLLATSQTCTRTTATGPATPTVAVTDAAGGIGGAAGANGDLGSSGTAGQGQKQAPPPKTSTPATGVQAAPTTTCTSDSDFAVIPAIVAFLGTVFLGGALMLLLLMASRARGGPRPVTPVSPGPAPAAAVAGGTGRAEADRKTLVQAVIYVRDRVTSKALADRLGAALHDVGVETVDPVGARFDPAHHEAGGSAPSDDPARIGSIAAVEVPGYTDRGRILRAPVVTVYQAGRPTGGRGTDRSRGEHR
jgi:hypothetical protein